MYGIAVWKQLRQNTLLYIILTLNRCVYISNGSVLIVARALFFMVQMYLSSSGTCSSWVVSFSIMPCNTRFFLRHLNCPSASIFFTLNPLAVYVSIICLKDFINVFFHLFHFLSFLPRKLCWTWCCDNEQYQFVQVHYIYCQCDIFMSFQQLGW